MEFPSSNLGKKKRFLLVCAILHNRGSDSIDRKHRGRRSDAHGLIIKDELLYGTFPLPAIFLRPTHSNPTILAKLLNEFSANWPSPFFQFLLFMDLRSDQISVILLKFFPEGLLFICKINKHNKSLSVDYSGAGDLKLPFLTDAFLITAFQLRFQVGRPIRLVAL